MKHYKRLGNCSKCGNCCKCLKFRIEGSNTSREFYEARGFMVFMSVHDGRTYVMMNHRCPNLKDDNSCALQKIKPSACRLSPQHPMHHEGIDCKYRWKEAEDANDKTDQEDSVKIERRESHARNDIPAIYTD